MDEGVFIHLLQMPMPMIQMNGVRGFPNLVAQFIDLSFHLYIRSSAAKALHNQAAKEHKEHKENE